MIQAQRPLVIAHRGASAQRPENTVPAYELAVELGADMIEIDLHLSSDRSIVVTHDASLAALGSGRWIEDASLAELLRVDMGQGEAMPLLGAVFERFGSRIDFNLEIKTARGGRPYPGLEALALEEVRARGLLERTLFSSFSDAVLEVLRKLEPRARLACLVEARRSSDMLERCRAVGAEALNPWFGLVQPELVESAHAAGLRVLPYTVDDESQMRRLLDCGVDGLFTNQPDRMIRLLAHAPGDIDNVRTFQG